MGFTCKRPLDVILRAKRQLRDNGSLIFVNEHRTQHRAKLASNTRQVMKDKKIADCWTSNRGVMTNTSVTNTSVTNTSVTNTSVTNTSVTNTSVTNTSMTNTSMTNTSVTNTSMANTSMTNTSMTTHRR